jgi:protein required for attachment to host cells
MKKNVTWVVVADHQHARVFANDGPGRGLQPVDGLAFDTHLKAGRDIMADKPGRSFESRGGSHHAIEPKTDPHREAGKRFISRVVGALEAASEKKDFDRLMLIAPPRALGEFRKLLPAPLKSKLIGETAEDLTKGTRAVIEAHVGRFMAV